MQFTARNRTGCPDDERWRNKYARALQLEDVNGLLEIVEEVKEKKDMVAREIHALCLENALRFSARTGNEEKCNEVISKMPRTECLPAKLEYFEYIEDYHRALSILRQMEKQEDTPSLVRKRRDLESKCPLRAYEGVKRRVFRADASNIYAFLIVLSRKIEKDEILVTDYIRLTVSSHPYCSWLDEIESWMTQCLPSNHVLGIDTAIKSCLAQGKVSAEECVMSILECFARRWRKGLMCAEKNVFLHPITVLASFLPASRLSRSLVSFLCFLINPNPSICKPNNTQGGCRCKGVGNGVECKGKHGNSEHNTNSNNTYSDVQDNGKHSNYDDMQDNDKHDGAQDNGKHANIHNTNDAKYNTNSTTTTTNAQSNTNTNPTITTTNPTTTTTTTTTTTNEYTMRLLGKVSTAIFRYGQGKGKWDMEREGGGSLECHSRNQQLDSLFVQYLLGATGKKILEYVRKSPLQGLWRAEQLHFRVLEEALRRQDPDMTVIIYAMISGAESARAKEESEKIKAAHCISAYKVAHPIAQAYLLQQALQLGSRSDQAVFFATANLKLPWSMFGYAQAVYLLEISPPGTHLSFFSRFFSPQDVLSRGIIRWQNQSGSSNHVILNCLQIRRARRALVACIRAPKKMLPPPIDPDGPMTQRILQVFLHQRAYISALSLRPFDCRLISNCIRKYAEQAEEAVRRQKAGISRIYAKIIACSNLFISSACNRHSLLGVEVLAEVYPVLLGFLALLEMGGKKNLHRTTKEIQPTKEEYTGLFSALKVMRKYLGAVPGAQGLDDTLSSFRLSLGSEGCVSVLPEKEITDNGSSNNSYDCLLGYDLWMLAQRKGALKKQHIAVLSYAVANIASLGAMEYDTLLKIRGKRIRESFWGKIFRNVPVGQASSVGQASVGQTSIEQASVDHVPVDHTSVGHLPVDHVPVDHVPTSGAERMEVLRKETSQQMQNEYLQYLTRQKGEDLSYFMFPLLKKGAAPTKKSLKESVHKMFFTGDNTVVTDFSSWVPGIGVIKRKEYFMFLFSYLEENDIFTLEQVKTQLRKRGFGVN